MVHRVIFVVESPMSQRDVERFGVAALRSAGYVVEAWEICDLTLPKSRLQWYAHAHNVCVQRILDWNQLGQFASKLTKKDAVILVCGTRAPLSGQYSTLLTSVLTSPAIVGALVSGTLPPAHGQARLWELASGCYSQVKSKLLSRVPIPRSLDFVWADTTARSVARSLIGRTTTVRIIHALDYDRVLDLGEKREGREYALLLDAMGPFHPDYVTLDIPNPWTPTCYAQVVSALQMEMERRDIDIVVAAHPRAQEGSLDHLYPGIRVVHGQTVELLASCAFVISIEGSTALGMAAALRKPVLFITSECIPKSIRLLRDRFVRALNAPTIDKSELSSIILPPALDENQQAEYEHNYMKVPGSTRGLFWEVVAQDLRASWSA